MGMTVKKKERLQGEIQSITFTNEETGFTVAKVKVKSYSHPVTVVGRLMNPLPGEDMKMEGEWIKHPRYGEQFQLESYEPIAPESTAGIKRYLGSGLVKGIGPSMASRIVDRFQEKTLAVIEEDIQQLLEVEGMGKKRISMIKEAWEEQKDLRRIMVFFLSYGIGSGEVKRIFRQYGGDSISKVKENPYRLATDITGIGFLTADRIAQKMGFGRDSLVRVEAGILYVLEELAGEGHVYYPYEPLVEKCLEILQVDQDLILEAFARVAQKQHIIIEDLNPDLQQYIENNKAVYLGRYHYCETSIASRLKALSGEAPPFRPIDPQKALDWVAHRLPVRLAREQVEAVQYTLKSKVLVITGGPGTGKTTIINAVLQIFSVLKLEIQLAAPTGRAAKRMSEATGHPAKTIHRLLEFTFKKGNFLRNAKNPLTCHLLIIDEASMIDTLLMHHLLKAIPSYTVLILVGDIKQLPSVGAGSVLRDIIDSGSVPVVTLHKIFRQAKESSIIVNSHRINHGQLPLLGRKKIDDFYFLEEEDPQACQELILSLVKDRLPARFAYHPLEDIQVLSPMHKGCIGTSLLNDRLQSALNPKGQEISHGGRTFRVGDKVMQIRNDYDREVFNGDIGRIISLQEGDQELTVSFDGRSISFQYRDLEAMVLAYAISVHKAQGSEYRAVILPLMTQHYIMLQRNLIYTAVTRGKELVVIVGQKKALEMGIKNDAIQRRYSRLKERLQPHG